MPGMPYHRSQPLSEAGFGASPGFMSSLGEFLLFSLLLVIIAKPGSLTEVTLILQVKQTLFLQALQHYLGLSFSGEVPLHTQDTLLHGQCRL